MDDPEPPVVHDREIGPAGKEHRGQIEKGYGEGSNQKELGDLRLFRDPLNASLYRPEDKEPPEDEARCKQYLPGPRPGQDIPIPGGRTRTMPFQAVVARRASRRGGFPETITRGPRKQVNPSPSALWVLLLPREDARNSPPATHAVAIQKMASCRCQVRSMLLGKDEGEIKAIEARRVRTVMGRGASHERLHKKEQGSHDKIFYRRLLAFRCHAGKHLRMDMFSLGFPAEIPELAEREKHEGRSGEQCDEA